MTNKILYIISYILFLILFNSSLWAQTQARQSGDGMYKFYLSAAWQPVIPLYGGMSDIFGQELHGAGVAIRFGFLYTKPQWFIPGLELSTSWYSLNRVQNNDTVGLFAEVIGLNITAQKLLPNRKMAVMLRAGGAFVLQTGALDVGKHSFPMGGLSSHINLEASFLWFALSQLYLESGLNFAFLFSQNDNSGCIKPWLGAGWRF